MKMTSSSSLLSGDDIIVSRARMSNILSSAKTCKVCGDRATGCNFSVITCESCKAFFRRNANRQESLKCPFNQKCVINVGMKWTMREGYRSRKQRLSTIPGNDEEIKKIFDQINDGDVAVPKQVLMELVKKSTMRRLTTCQCRCTCGFYPSDTKLTAEVLSSSFAEQIPQETDEIVVPFNSVNQFPQTNHDNFYSQQGGIDYSLTMTSMPQMSPEISTTWNENTRLTPLTTMQQASISDNSYFSANAFERLFTDDKLLIQELVTANDILKQPLHLSTNQRHSSELSLMDVVQMTDLALRRIISMAKELTFFKSLSSKDQIAILKGSCSELLILRGVMVFDQKKHAWNTSVRQVEIVLQR
ncbi:unnamed protein product [Litomosoides sigmodontis]|uniref:Nuclear receptor domain-containing protein n=1 Tax=Litomosoides sigmodontis TaxID=42156 RepID=A0A3P6USE2_LITSI|nr:unnamed protein product [Litomosoides sigmodontis]